MRPGLVSIQVLVRHVIVQHLMGVNLAPISTSGIFNATHNAALEGVSFLKQFVNTCESAVSTLDKPCKSPDCPPARAAASIREDEPASLVRLRFFTEYRRPQRTASHGAWARSGRRLH
jgi:hypothetical protein